MDKAHGEAEEAIRQQFGLAPDAVLHVCLADDMHPYNCDGMFGGSCIYCEECETEEHDPAICALCRWEDKVEDTPTSTP